MAEKIITLAYNSGVNFFDTSEYYSEGRYVSKISFFQYERSQNALHLTLFSSFF